MSAFNWPDSSKLPAPNEDLSNKVQKNVIRTQMDTNLFRQRKRFTSGLRTINVSWLFTDAQYALFQGIYKYKISDGADWFNMSLPFGDGFKTYLVRFTENGYSESYQPVMYHKVTATLETNDDTSPFSEDDVDAALA